MSLYIYIYIFFYRTLTSFRLRFLVPLLHSDKGTKKCNDVHTRHLHLVKKQYTNDICTPYARGNVLNNNTSVHVVDRYIYISIHI